MCYPVIDVAAEFKVDNHTIRHASNQRLRSPRTDWSFVVRGPKQLKQAMILVRCTADEAELIRQAAKREHLSVSRYLLDTVAHHIAAGKKPEEQLENLLNRSTGTWD